MESVRQELVPVTRDRPLNTDVPEAWERLASRRLGRRAFANVRGTGIDVHGELRPIMNMTSVK